MNKAGHSQKEIAVWLARSPSTIRRTLRCKRGLRSYRPAEARRLSQARRREAHKARKIKGVKNVKDINTAYGPGRTGALSDGRKVTVRPGSTDGRPTLEIRRPNKVGQEIRYY